MSAFLMLCRGIFLVLVTSAAGDSVAPHYDNLVALQCACRYMACPMAAEQLYTLAEMTYYHTGILDGSDKVDTT